MRLAARSSNDIAVTGLLGLLVACSVGAVHPASVGKQVEHVQAPLSVRHSQKFNANGDEETLVRVHVTAKETGAAVGAARVSLRPSQGVLAISSLEFVDRSYAQFPQVPRTDNDGWCEFAVAPGVGQQLTAVDRGLLQVDRDIAPLARGESREIELKIPTVDDMRFHGRVVDDSNGTPIAGANLNVRRGEREFDLHCDADGRFELTAATWRFDEVLVTALGFARKGATLTQGHESAATAQDIRLAHAATLEVMVRASNGSAVPHVTVDVTCDRYFGCGGLSAEFSSDPSSNWQGRANAKGLAEIGALPPNEQLWIIVSASRTKPWREIEPLTLAAGEKRRVEVVVGSGAAIAGLVLDQDGRPVVGATIGRCAAKFEGPFWSPNSSEFAAETQTSSNGRFLFDRVEPGLWWVGPAANDEWFESDKPASDIAPLGQSVHVERGGPDVQVTLSVVRGLYIRGRVLDADGAPAAECLVSGEAERAWLNARTDDEGKFALGPLVPAAWNVYADARDSDGARSLSQQVDAGRSDVELHLRRGGSIHGLIKGVDGNSPSLAFVYVALRGDSHEGLSGRAASEGEFAIGSLLPGIYAIGVSTQAGEFAARERVEVRAGQQPTEIEFSLARGARLVLRYVGVQPYASIEAWSGDVPIQFDGIERGSSMEITVPAGEVEIHWTEHAERFEQRTKLVLSAGETREFEWAGKP